MAAHEWLDRILDKTPLPVTKTFKPTVIHVHTVAANRTPCPNFHITYATNISLFRLPSLFTLLIEIFVLHGSFTLDASRQHLVCG